MSYIGTSYKRIGFSKLALKVDLIVMGVYHAALVTALKYVHIARRSHLK